MHKEGMNMEAPVAMPMAREDMDTAPPQKTPAPQTHIPDADEAIIDLELDDGADTPDFHATMEIDMRKEGMHVDAPPADDTPVRAQPSEGRGKSDTVEEDEAIIDLEFDTDVPHVDPSAHPATEIDMDAPAAAASIPAKDDLSENASTPDTDGPIEEIPAFDATMAIDMRKEGMHVEAPAGENAAEASEPEVDDTDIPQFEFDDQKEAPSTQPAERTPAIAGQDTVADIDITTLAEASARDATAAADKAAAPAPDEAPWDPAVGRLLLTEGVLTFEEIKQLEAEAPANIRALLAGLTGPREAVLVQLLGRDYNVPEVALEQFDPSAAPMASLPRELAEQGFFPFAEAGNVTLIATPHVDDFENLTLVRESCGGKIKVFRAQAAAVAHAVSKGYLAMEAQTAIPDVPEAVEPKPISAAEAREMMRRRDRPTQTSQVLALAISDREIQSTLTATQEDVITQWEKRYASAGPIAAERIQAP